MASIVFLADSKNREYSSVVFPDVIFNIDHSLSNTITSYAIEKGSDGVFNSKPNNNIITISGQFGEYSRYSDGLERNTPVNDEIEKQGDTRTRRKRAFDKLKSYRDNRIFVDVVTGLNVYSNCLIQSINFSEDNKTQDVLPFTIVFEQPRIATVTEARNVLIVPLKADSASDATYNQTGKSEKGEEDKEFLVYKLGKLLVSSALSNELNVDDGGN